VDDGGHRSERSQRPLTQPLTAIASEADVEDARKLLDIHQPGTVVRRVCTGCGEAWPCLDTIYAWAVTAAKPECQP
jgi:hypothetical protein